MIAEPQQRLPMQARTYWALRYAGLGLAAGIAASFAFGLWATPLLALGPVTGIALAVLRWRRWRYEVREDEIDLRHGVLTERRTLVPIRRVQHVDTETGPLQSTFDLATVSFHTAAGRTQVPALSRGEAERVRRRVGELARTRDDT